MCSNGYDALHISFLLCLEQLLKFLDTWPGSSLYNGYDSSGEPNDGYPSGQVTYRRYINGIPIYDSRGMGSVRMKMANSGPVEIQFPTQIIQTPLEDRQRNVSLVPGEEVIIRLEDGGYSFSEIQMIEVAYGWKESEESNRIVELTPMWFIKMEGTWKTLDTWLTEPKEAMSDGL